MNYDDILMTIRRHNYGDFTTKQKFIEMQIVLSPEMSQEPTRNSENCTLPWIHPWSRLRFGRAKSFDLENC